MQDVNLTAIRESLDKNYPTQMSNTLFAAYLTSSIRIDMFAQLSEVNIEDRLSHVHSADSANFKHYLSQQI